MLINKTHTGLDYMTFRLEWTYRNPQAVVWVCILVGLAACYVLASLVLLAVTGLDRCS